MSEKPVRFNARNGLTERRKSVLQINRVQGLSVERPILIAGPTASGKSALAMRIAAQDGGVIVNADAIQVYANWRVLTARPSQADEDAHPHRLFGHVAADHSYSVGEWLREVESLLQGPDRLIIIGGTGLYFRALTEGLAEIPPIPAAVRSAGDALREQGALAQMREEIDPASAARIDMANPARVQRAWEVLRATGRGIAAWQDATPAPLLPDSATERLVLDAPKDWLSPRIENRFDLMLAQGALEEARANLPGWDPALPSSKAIGAPELIAHLRGEMTLDAAREAAVIATRQFAKRQRTWFRARMTTWTAITP
ncbi:tRNA (adenosine(37)-N6)-dimethylallyltransferase MiaA [Pseudooceanicola sediminis]|uniref:tRNA dimethylallyltransferase n=1 Tax=Pseudooceanicola sediminis TaxID=2211117 RepID=A0A399J5P0_9RHOB|nr:tRNA (adenosine(37)-N6)-dimethylallyltransferase MiaA [Pseudooceanicola sediminis]KAA2316863.1 tRNA (adenosine(37)-N6)-dimethylallyltransferase MiaA [Puniceibacterium sp. HSS470]RII40681.1 tRNA (adenosine(37)-N6)-dimethylallyltransferase MiaA [Pseudooceanicola sediminis]|tara:strand:+ start:140114 stop:141055 length:942 start_codon:yes stop_codon:yes gene_type:complete